MPELEIGLRVLGQAVSGISLAALLRMPVWCGDAIRSLAVSRRDRRGIGGEEPVGSGNQKRDNFDLIRAHSRFFSGHPLSRLLGGCGPDRFFCQ